MVALTLMVGWLTIGSTGASAAGDYRFAITDASATEGSNVVFQISVTPTPAAGDSVSVAASTVPISATEGAACPGAFDYEDTTAQVFTFTNLTANPQALTVETCGDTTAEGNEQFQANLSNASVVGCVGVCTTGFADQSGIGTILDDEPFLTISDVSANEGNTGTTPFTFTITSSQPVPAGCTYTINYSTSDASATAGSDYQATSGSTTITQGNVLNTAPVTVNVLGDTTVEPNEVFNVAITGVTAPGPCPVVPFVADGTGTGTIVNDEAAASPSASPSASPTATPGNTVRIARTGLTSTTCTFSVTSTPSAAGVRVDIVNHNGVVKFDDFEPGTFTKNRGPRRAKTFSLADAVGAVIGSPSSARCPRRAAF